MKQWWKRNRLWLLLLVPIAVLAVVTSSYRFVNFYLRWGFPEVVAANSSVGSLVHPFDGGDGKQHTRDVTVTVNSVAAVPEWDGAKAATGGTLWLVELTLEAAPDQFLFPCQLWLVDDKGALYKASSAGKVASGSALSWRSAVPTCVPSDTPGPQFNLVGEVIETTPQRPASWDYSYAIVLPESATPKKLRLSWDTSATLQLDVPSR